MPAIRNIKFTPHCFRLQGRVMPLVQYQLNRISVNVRLSLAVFSMAIESIAELTRKAFEPNPDRFHSFYIKNKQSKDNIIFVVSCDLCLRHTTRLSGYRRHRRRYGLCARICARPLKKTPLLEILCYKQLPVFLWNVGDSHLQFFIRNIIIEIMMCKITEIPLYCHDFFIFDSVDNNCISENQHQNIYKENCKWRK